MLLFATLLWNIKLDRLIHLPGTIASYWITPFDKRRISHLENFSPT